MVMLSKHRIVTIAPVENSQYAVLGFTIFSSIDVVLEKVMLFHYPGSGPPRTSVHLVPFLGY